MTNTQHKQRCNDVTSDHSVNEQWHFNFKFCECLPVHYWQ